MKWIVGAALVASFVCCPGRAGALDIPFRDDCAFYVSFDAEDFDADVADGKAEGERNKGTPPEFADGLRGKAMSVVYGGATFDAKDNFSFGRPGSVSLWVQPVQWKRKLELPADPNSDSGRRTPTYNCFFGTPYNPDGYMGIQRMTSVHLEGAAALDSIMVFAHGYPKLLQKNNNARAPHVDWADGEWHHIALTWDKEEFRLYLDGKIGAQVPVAGRIDPEDDAAQFFMGASEPTLIDEVAVYKRVLSEGEIKTLFDSYKK